MPTPMQSTPQHAGVQRLFEAVAEAVASRPVFAEVRREGSRVVCVPSDAGGPAAYRVEMEEGRVWVSLVTPDRWLSESIESDLVDYGDKIEELLNDELIDAGHAADPAIVVQHFRSADKLFTFRTPLAIDPHAAGEPAAAAMALRYLLAYESCFRQLGDMDGSGDGPA